jgi:hypothetical protein
MLKLISGLEKELASIAGSQQPYLRSNAPEGLTSQTADPLGVSEASPAGTSDPGSATRKSTENPD